jgi:hypothetical protein
MGSRLVLLVLGALVLAGLVVGGILFLRDDDPAPPTEYDARIEDDFMATCTTDAESLGFSRAGDYCRCAYDRIREDIPFDRFLEIDAALAEDPSAVPDDVDRPRTSCYLQVEAAGTVPAGDGEITVTPSTTEP